jgi:hypothetical protein
VWRSEREIVIKIGGSIGMEPAQLQDAYRRELEEEPG